MRQRVRNRLAPAWGRRYRWHMTPEPRVLDPAERGGRFGVPELAFCPWSERRRRLTGGAKGAVC